MYQPELWVKLRFW